MKKFLKLISIIFMVVSTIIIIGILYFVISNKMFLEYKNQENINYLATNKVFIKDSIDGKLFDEQFYNSNVFLLGEIHGYADNQILDREMLIFLNKKLGIKYYIAEMDSVTATKLNTFLSNNTKDEGLLKEVVRSIGKRIPQQCSVELLNKWNHIYAYNQSLEDSLRIKVIGIDTSFDNTSSDISRDAAMVLNFNNAVKKQQLENEKFYGFFGYFHVLQKSGQKGDKPFGERVRESGYKVKSFVSQTIDSEMYLPKNPQFPTPPDEKIDWINADGPMMVVKGINDLKEWSGPNSITLFKLDSPQSPYLNSKNLSSIKSTFFGENFVPLKENTTTDYFQYIFLVSNSKALTKLE